MIYTYSSVFWELIRTPFTAVSLVWGIVPLYFGLFLSELTGSKANFRTGIQTGFSFLWAGAQWLYPYFRSQGPAGPRIEWHALQPVNLVVTGTVILLGAIALWGGLRRKFPPYMSFLGHTRFSNYFMITLFPIQANALMWSWDRLIAIALFALPIWLVLHFGLAPLRKK